MYGIGTDAGKTHTICTLQNNKLLKSKKIFTIKPIISGFDHQNYTQSDNFKLLKASGNTNPLLHEVEAISCYLLKEPLSPDIASNKENIEIDFKKIITFCEKEIQKIDSDNSLLLIETAGGVCTPASNRHTMADLSKALQQYKPCNILISTEYLGAISHTLSALYILKFDIIIFNRSSNDFIQSVKNHLPYNVEIFNELSRP